jgi:hypothetical protein
MLEFLKRASRSLGVSQNAARVQAQLQDELNLHVKVVQHIVSGGAKAGVLALVAAVAALIALVVGVVMTYAILLPHTGKVGALALVAGFFAVCAIGFALRAINHFKTLPRLKKISIPPIYVPLAPTENEPTTGPSSEGRSTANGLDADLTSQLSDFLLSEFRKRFYDSTLDTSVKNFATSLGGDSRRVVGDVVGSLSEQLASQGTPKKIAILAAAVAAGFLVSQSGR